MLKNSQSLICSWEEIISTASLHMCCHVIITKHFRKFSIRRSKKLGFWFDIVIDYSYYTIVFFLFILRSIFLVISQGTVTLKIKSMKVCSKLLRGGGEGMERGWRGGHVTEQIMLVQVFNVQLFVRIYNVTKWGE